nr:MAG TPA: hypothetical protein [Caudoviricetes sp.]
MAANDYLIFLENRVFLNNLFKCFLSGTRR